MRPKDAQSGAGGSGAAGGRAARGGAAEGRSTARSLRASTGRRAWLATERRQTRMLRKVAAAPEAPGARSAPDEFLSVYSPFNLISNPLVRSGCSAQPGGPSLLNYFMHCFDVLKNEIS